MSECQDRYKQRLTEHWTNIVNDFADAQSRSFGNLVNNPLIQDLMQRLSDVAANFLDNIMQQVMEGVMTYAQAFIARAMAILTFADEIQLALFSRLVDQLKLYLSRRIEIVESINLEMTNLQTLLAILEPKDPPIVGQVRLSRSKLQEAERYLEIVRRGVLASPPRFFRGFIGRATFQVNLARLALADMNGVNESQFENQDLLTWTERTFVQYDDNGNRSGTRPSRSAEVTGVDDIFWERWNAAVNNTVEQYVLAGQAIYGTLARIANLVSELGSSVENVLRGMASLDMNIPGGAQRDLSTTSGKIKLTATGVAIFPFQIIAMRQLLNLYAIRITEYKDDVQEIIKEMTDKLFPPEGQNIDIPDLHLSRLRWITRLNVIQSVYGGGETSPLSPFDDAVESTGRDLVAAQAIIAYLAQPGYIKDINKFSDKIKQNLISLAGFIIISIVSPAAYRKSRSLISSVKKNAAVIMRQDRELLGLLYSLDTRITNPLVAEALAHFESMVGGLLGEGQMGTASTILAAGFSSLGLLGGGATNFLNDHVTALAGDYAETFIPGLSARENISGLLSSGIYGNINDFWNCIKQQNLENPLEQTSITQNPELLVSNPLETVQQSNDLAALSLSDVRLKPGIQIVQYPEYTPGQVIVEGEG